MNEQWLVEDLPAATLWRRLVAMSYDLFLVIAMWMVTLFIWATIVKPTAFSGNSTKLMSDLLALIWWLETWAFYAWCWMHGGQTLGMRAWRLMVRDYRRRPVRLWQTLARFVFAHVSWLLAGGGYLLSLFSPHQTLHDRLSATETVVVPKAG